MKFQRGRYREFIKELFSSAAPGITCILSVITLSVRFVPEPRTHGEPGV